MSTQEAIDLLDTYGADTSRWPAGAVSTLNAVKSDPAVVKHLGRIRKLDQALSHWKPDEKGAEIAPDKDEKPEGDPETGQSEHRFDEKEDDKGEDQSEGTKNGSSAPKHAGGETGEGEDEDGEGPGDDESSPCERNGCGVSLSFDQLEDLETKLAEAIKSMLAKQFNPRMMVSYTRDWDRIEPYDDKGGQTPNVAETENKVAVMTQTMQKELQRLIVARSQSRMSPGFRRGRINASALHRVRSGDDRVFRRKEDAVTNKVAVSLVIDNSGSMRGSKVETAMLAAWAFAQTLDRIKVPCEVIGFTGSNFDHDIDYRDLANGVDEMVKATGVPHGAIRMAPIYMPIYKGFDEKFGPQQKRRMAHLIRNQGILSDNNDAMAIEYASERLAKRPETRKIMIVFSDGEPACFGVRDQGVLNYTLKTHIANLTKRGIEILGIGIQSQAVKNFYPKNHVIQNIDELPSFVLRHLRKFLLPA